MSDRTMRRVLAAGLGVSPIRLAFGRRAYKQETSLFLRPYSLWGWHFLAEPGAGVYLGKTSEDVMDGPFWRGPRPKPKGFRPADALVYADRLQEEGELPEAGVYRMSELCYLAWMPDRSEEAFRAVLPWSEVMVAWKPAQLDPTVTRFVFPIKAVRKILAASIGYPAAARHIQSLTSVVVGSCWTKTGDYLEELPPSEAIRDITSTLHRRPLGIRLHPPVGLAGWHQPRRVLEDEPGRPFDLA